MVSYNVLDGGEGRADPLAEVILAQRPDIVALVEADDAAVVQRIAGRLKMDVVHAEGRRHGTAILSRWPMLESINHSPRRDELSDCLLEVLIAEPGKPPLTIAAVHLHAQALEEDERKREREIDVILDLFAAHRREHRPHILAGDFNANSPIQRIDPQLCKPRMREDWQANGGHVPRRAVQKLLDAGYVDSLTTALGDKAGTIGSFTTRFPGQRVDYIFIHGIDSGHVKSAWVEHDRLAQYASDHFPVGAEIG
jgi:endonuclease/exonuclease/phosphatase family metal-dependent hydrolase